MITKEKDYHIFSPDGKRACEKWYKPEFVRFIKFYIYEVAERSNCSRHVFRALRL
jgi:hypothetical protein